MHVQLDARDRVEGKRRRRRLAHVVLRVVREGERKGSGQIGPNPSLSCWAMPGPEPLSCGCNRGGGGLPAAALASRRSSRRPTARRPSPPPPSRRRPTPRRPPRRGARGGAPRRRAEEARHQRREHLRPPEQAAAAAAAAEARCKGMQRACSDPGQRACHAKQRMWMGLGGGRGVSPPAAARGAAWPLCASRRSIRRSCRTRPNRARTARGGGGGGRWRRHNKKGEAGWLGEGQGESRRGHATMAAGWWEVEGREGGEVQSATWQWRCATKAKQVWSSRPSLPKMASSIGERSQSARHVHSTRTCGYGRSHGRACRRVLVRGANMEARRVREHDA